jgi:hypothetical protein
VTRPIARPIAQRSGAQTPPSGGAFPLVPTGKDGATAPSTYLTSTRLDHIAHHLSDLDQSVLDFLATSRLATSKQLVRRFWTAAPASNPAAARAARRALKRLSDWRVFTPLPDRARGGVRGGSATLIYAVGPAGVKLLARRGLRLRRVGIPSDRFIRHTLASTGLVVNLCVADASGVLELIEVQQEPTSHRAFLGPFGRQWVKPDLFVRIGAGALEDRWFIEVDLATEHAGTLRTKSERYLAHLHSGEEQRAHGTYPRVLWAVPDDRRAGQMAAMLRRLPEGTDGLFSICRLDDVVTFLAAEARE